MRSRIKTLPFWLTTHFYNIILHILVRFFSLAMQNLSQCCHIELSQACSDKNLHNLVISTLGDYKLTQWLLTADQNSFKLGIFFCKFTVFNLLCAQIITINIVLFMYQARVVVIIGIISLWVVVVCLHQHCHKCNQDGGHAHHWSAHAAALDLEIVASVSNAALGALLKTAKHGYPHNVHVVGHVKVIVF